MFGLSGAAVPYSYSITYDMALDTNSFFFPTGAALGSDVTTHDWYGYSASGITATTLTFGTKTWTVAALNPRVPAVGASADLWFGTDISQSAPTRCWVLFSQGGTLQLGAGSSAFGQIFMSLVSSVFDPSAIPPGATSSDLSIAAAPEPSIMALLALAGVAPRLVRRQAVDPVGLQRLG